MISLYLSLSLLLPMTPQDSHTEFRKNFGRAMEINATTEMAQLVKRNQEEAVAWIILTAETIATGSNEELATRMTALRKAWKTSMETSFAGKMEEYFSLLAPALMRERLKLKAEYDKLNKDYWSNQESKDGPTFVIVGGKFAGLAESFATLGDHFYSSQCWGFYGICFGKEMRADKADLYEAYRGASMCVSERLEIELKDRFYLSNKQIADHLKANGFDKGPAADGEEEGEGSGSGAGPPGAGASGGAKGPKTSGKEILAPLSFEAVEDLDEFVRPSYFVDGIYVMWNAVNLGARGDKKKVSTLQKLSPNFHRTGSSEVMIDTDGDGEGDKKVPLTGNMELVSFKIGKDAEERDWACHAIVGTEKDLYQGFERGMGIYDQSIQLFFFNAASVVGEVAGKRIQIVDDNGDGIYGSPPVPWGYAGLTAGNLHPEMDCVRVGNSKRAQPWSEYQKIGDDWYKLAVTVAADELVATPVTLETGTLKLKFKGGKPAWMIVKGKGRYEGCYFDLLWGGSKGVEVPVGSYELFCGDLRKGRKRQTAKALVLPGKDMESWQVAVGETTTIELGGPFSYDFSFENADAEVRVIGQTVAVVGVAGERYERPWNCRPAPDVFWKEVGKSRGNKAERMKLINDQLDMFEEGAYTKVWFPLDCEFEVRSETVELKLSEKKNALFGKLESAWKE